MKAQRRDSLRTAITHDIARGRSVDQSLHRRDRHALDAIAERVATRDWIHDVETIESEVFSHHPHGLGDAWCIHALDLDADPLRSNRDALQGSRHTAVVKADLRTLHELLSGCVRRDTERQSGLGAVPGLAVASRQQGPESSDRCGCHSETQNAEVSLEEGRQEVLSPAMALVVALG